MKIYIVGAGVGDPRYITEYAKDLISTANIVITTERLFSKLAFLNPNTLCKEISEFAPFLQQNCNEFKSVAVLASGDIGFYSIAKSLSVALADFEIELVSGLSSLQYLSAKIGVSYEDIKVVTVHGRDTSCVPFVCYNRRVFLLTGGKNKVGDLLDEMVQVGLGDVFVTVGENLSDENERVLSGTAEKLRAIQFDSLAVMLVQNNNFVDSHKKIYDHEFIRGKTPMTKEVVRTASISYLDINPTDRVVDIGAGTGSVSIEIARRSNCGIVYAVEKQDEAVELIKQNCIKHGAYNVKVIALTAPDCLEQLPPFDKAFIGGSSGRLDKIMAALTSKNPNIRVVINAITLETVSEAIAVLKKFDFETKISCINVSNAHAVGGYNMMKAENPIYIIVGEKRHD